MISVSENPKLPIQPSPISLPLGSYQSLCPWFCSCFIGSFLSYLVFKVQNIQTGFRYLKGYQPHSEMIPYCHPKMDIMAVRILCLLFLITGFPGSSVVKNLPANARDTGDAGSIPGSERSPGVGNGNPLQYCCLGNPMDRGTVHGVTKSQTRLSEHARMQEQTLDIHNKQ